MESGKSRSRLRRRSPWILCAVVAALAMVVLDFKSAPGTDVPSKCFGQVHKGRLENGWKLPSTGTNFAAYSTLGWGLGRTYVHSAVYQVVLDAYASLLKTDPELRFLYGETGWEHGDRFRPHRTHRNGTSVDFISPVRDAEGRPATLPTHPFNAWGYRVDFDADGKWGDYTIDLDAIAGHLAALSVAARHRRVRISKVVLFPELRKKLRRTPKWSEISRLPFTRKEAWVRHDDHFHLDFAVGCSATHRRPQAGIAAQHGRERGSIF